MARRRPSLKDYLTTGKVFVEDVPGAAEPVAVEPLPAEARNAAPGKEPAGSGSLPETLCAETTAAVAAPETPLPPRILEILGDADREQWTPLLTAAAVEERPIGELSARREEFRTLDRGRYTLFLLDAPKGTLTPVRTSVRIREPLAALLLWDETGSAVVYYSEALV